MRVYEPPYSAPHALSPIGFSTSALFHFSTAGYMLFVRSILLPHFSTFPPPDICYSCEVSYPMIVYVSYLFLKCGIDGAKLRSEDTIPILQFIHICRGASRARSISRWSIPGRTLRYALAQAVRAVPGGRSTESASAISWSLVHAYLPFSCVKYLLHFGLGALLSVR
jgi:hypothetical protein